MVSLRKLFVFILFSLLSGALISGCDGGGSGSSAGSTSSDGGASSVADIYDLEAYVDPSNSLRIIVEWKTLAQSTGKVEYRTSSGSDWLSTPESSSEGATHKISVVGLTADTSYVLRPVSGGLYGTETTVSTGSLPAEIPKSSVTVPNVSTTDITMGISNTDKSIIVGVAGNGKVVWYHKDSENAVPDNLRINTDGRLLYNTSSAIKAVDYAGNEETIISFSEPIHHDFLVTPSGTYMYLSRTSVYTGTDTFCTDDIIERDKNGNVIWRWRTSDHVAELGAINLDNRYQEYTVQDCGFDWTHANTLFMKTDSSGKKFVLLSIRSMSRIIKIDYDTGAIVWQLGDGLDFTPEASSGTTFSWFIGQHASAYLSETSIILFDNGNGYGSSISRLLIFKIDETNMTAKLTWEYDFNSTAPHSGFIYPLDNGNLLITFPIDSEYQNAFFVELTLDKTTAWRTDFLFSDKLPGNYILGNRRVSSLYDLTSGN